MAEQNNRPNQPTRGNPNRPNPGRDRPTRDNPSSGRVGSGGTGRGSGSGSGSGSGASAGRPDQRADPRPDQRPDQRADKRPDSRGANRTGGDPTSGRRDDKRPDKRADSRGGQRADSRGDRRGDRGSFGGGDRRGDRTSSESARTVAQARYDGPEIDETITGNELDHNITQQLRGLPEKLAARVARHLVAAGLLLDQDPETAYQHTLAARARAARIAVVREACGEAAYAAGHYPEALAELRAAKRMNGNQEYLPVMADCERALGRPDRALTLAHSPAVTNLPDHLKAEMTIVEAGARRDQGQLDAALRTLENAPLRSRTRATWVVRLRYAYADTLQAAGHTDQAIEWFHRTIGIDTDQTTDATERVTHLEQQQH